MVRHYLRNFAVVYIFAVLVARIDDRNFAFAWILSSSCGRMLGFDRRISAIQKKKRQNAHDVTAIITTGLSLSRMSPMNDDRNEIIIAEDDITKSEKDEILEYLSRRKKVADTTSSSLPLVAFAVSLFFAFTVMTFGGYIFFQAQPSGGDSTTRIDADSILRQDYSRLDSSVSFEE